MTPRGNESLDQGLFKLRAVRPRIATHDDFGMLFSVSLPKFRPKSSANKRTEFFAHLAFRFAADIVGTKNV